MSLLRTYRTLRHLKPSQIWGRLTYRLARPAPDLSLAPPVCAESSGWTPPAMRPARMLGPELFRFLNEQHDLARPADWDDPELARLWRYNLHYFEDLVGENAPARRDWHARLIARWIDENPPGTGTGWEPYPTSLRIVNWIKWALAGNTLPPKAPHSLAVQARWLGRRLEWRLLGNHLLANAKALFFAGCYFAGDEARAWRTSAEYILGLELPDTPEVGQVLPDGGHVETSPLYHCLALEDVLDLVNIARVCGRTPLRHWPEVARDMLRWLGCLLHPDGDPALFGDTAFGVAPTPAELFAYARRLRIALPPPPPPGFVHLPDTGYVRAEEGPATAFLDIGPIGPDWLPAHGHADTGGFELSLFGRRAVVDSGVSCYGTGAERLRQRGTAAHNTLVVDGEDSSEVWHGFRVARRSRILHASCEPAENTVRVKHDGYARLPGRPVHARAWTLTARDLLIVDKVEGSCRHRLELPFHIHPDLRVEQAQRHYVELRDEDRRLLAVLSFDPAVEVRVEETTYHPEFGLRLPTRKVVARCEAELPTTLTTRIRWGE